MTPRRIIKALASLKLAVFVIIAIATLAAWGTIVEAKFNSAAAIKIVYQSPYMYGVMILLAINLIAVMVDRWPWKKRHAPFVLAHIGILILMIGAQITQSFGIDGSMTFAIGEKGRKVIVSPTELSLFVSFDGNNPQRLFSNEVDFFMKSPKKNPLKIPTQPGESDIEVIDYYPYALRDEKLVESDKPEDGMAIRLQLKNDNVNMTEWLAQPTAFREIVRELGPARLVLSPFDYKPGDENVVVFKPRPDGGADYFIHSKREKKITQRGTARARDVIETGWMGLKIHVLKMMPKSRNQVEFKPLVAPTDLTTAALKVRFQNQEHWFALNSFVKLFTSDKVYILLYANRMIDIGFDIFLESFKVGRYPGTMRAASYESVVQVPELGQVNISMNEPLHHKGLTFYQASFNEDESGKPTHSVLSVNRDPGRWIKHLGCILMVLGIILLFYRKPMPKSA